MTALMQDSILRSLRREAARKSNLDADKVTLTKAADAIEELLTELHNMVAIYWGREGDGGEPPPSCIVRARAAIAKAEGRS